MKLYKFDQNYNLVQINEDEANFRPKPAIIKPENAELVFKGVLYDVYQWQQEQFDGTKSTFETLKRRDSVNIIPITKEGKFILTQQEQPAAKPFMGSLGGRVEKDETFLEAGVRELDEEGGITAGEWINFLDYQGSSKIDWATKTFFVRDLTIGKSHIDSGEKIKLIELSFDEYLHSVTKEDYRDWEITLKIFQIIKQGKLANLKQALIG